MAEFDFDGVGGGFSWKIIPRLLAYAALLVIGAFGSYWLGLKTGSFYLSWTAAMLSGITLSCSNLLLFAELEDSEFGIAESQDSLFKQTLDIGFIFLIALLTYFAISVFKDGFYRDNSLGSTVAFGIFYGFFFGPLFQKYLSNFRSRGKQGQP